MPHATGLGAGDKCAGVDSGVLSFRRGKWSQPSPSIPLAPIAPGFWWALKKTRRQAADQPAVGNSSRWLGMANPTIRACTRGRDEGELHETLGDVPLKSPSSLRRRHSDM